MTVHPCNCGTCEYAEKRDVIDHIEGRIEGLEYLMATPANERTESAQDDKLKEALFELELVRDLIKGDGK